MLFNEPFRIELYNRCFVVISKTGTHLFLCRRWLRRRRFWAIESTQFCTKKLRHSKKKKHQSCFFFLFLVFFFFNLRFMFKTKKFKIMCAINDLSFAVLFSVLFTSFEKQTKQKYCPTSLYINRLYFECVDDHFFVCVCRRKQQNNFEGGFCQLASITILYTIIYLHYYYYSCSCLGAGQCIFFHAFIYIYTNIYIYIY